jgi:hypothetical protein
VRESVLMVDSADGVVANRFASGYDDWLAPDFDSMIGKIHFGFDTKGTHP